MQSEQDETLESVRGRLVDFVVSAAGKHAAETPGSLLSTALVEAVRQTADDAVAKRVRQLEDGEADRVADATAQKILEHLSRRSKQTAFDHLGRHPAVAIAIGVVLLAAAFAGGFATRMFTAPAADTMVTRPAGQMTAETGGQTTDQTPEGAGVDPNSPPTPQTEGGGEAPLQQTTTP